MITFFVIAGVILVYDKHAWVIIIVGVILVDKELTTSVVSKYTDNNMPSNDSLILHNACCVYISIRIEIPSGTIHVQI
jgi:hypothetical protein